MKRFILLTGIICSVLNAGAQIQYGVKGGLNLANVGGADTEDNKIKPGFHIGGFATVPIAAPFSIQPELVLSTQGNNMKEEGVKSRVNTSYINLPVLAKYSFGQGFFAEAGPQLGFLLSAKIKADGESTNIKKDLKKMDFSWAIGVGYRVQEKLDVDARFNLGLSRLDKEGQYKAFNRVIQVGVLYTLGQGAGTAIR